MTGLPRAARLVATGPPEGRAARSALSLAVAVFASRMCWWSGRPLFVIYWRCRCASSPVFACACARYRKAMPVVASHGANTFGAFCALFCLAFLSFGLAAHCRRRLPLCGPGAAAKRMCSAALLFIGLALCCLAVGRLRPCCMLNLAAIRRHAGHVTCCLTRMCVVRKKRLF